MRYTSSLKPTIVYVIYRNNWWLWSVGEMDIFVISLSDCSKIARRGWAGWCKGLSRGRYSSIKPRCQGARLGAALPHPGAGHSARLAPGPGPGLGPLHNCVYDGNRPPEDDVCDGHPQPALQEERVQGGDQPVHTGAGLHTGSTQGGNPSHQSIKWFLLVVGHLRVSMFFFHSGICEAALSAFAASLCWPAARLEKWRDRVQRDPAGEDAVGVHRGGRN